MACIDRPSMKWPASLAVLLILCSAAVIIHTEAAPSVAEEITPELLLAKDPLAALQRAYTAVQVSIARAHQINVGSTTRRKTRSTRLQTLQHKHHLRGSTQTAEASPEGTITQPHASQQVVLSSTEQHSGNEVVTESESVVMPPSMRKHSFDDLAALLPKVSELRHTAPVRGIRHFAEEKRGKTQARIRAMHNRLRALKKSAHKQLMATATTEKQKAARNTPSGAVPSGVAAETHERTDDATSSRAMPRRPTLMTEKQESVQPEQERAIANAVASHGGQVQSIEMAHHSIAETLSHTRAASRSEWETGDTPTKRDSSRWHKATRSDIVHEAMASAMTFQAKEKHWKKMLQLAAAHSH